MPLTPLGIELFVHLNIARSGNTNIGSSRRHVHWRSKPAASARRILELVSPWSGGFEPGRSPSYSRVAIGSIPAEAGRIRCMRQF
jgi:hypothetical protein